VAQNWHTLVTLLARSRDASLPVLTIELKVGGGLGCPDTRSQFCAISVSVEAQSAWETDDSSLDDDETVALERADCLAVELPRVARACCDEA